MTNYSAKVIGLKRCTDRLYNHLIVCTDMMARVHTILYEEITIDRWFPFLLALNLNQCDRNFGFESHFACALAEFYVNLNVIL